MLDSTKLPWGTQMKTRGFVLGAGLPGFSYKMTPGPLGSFLALLVCYLLEWSWRKTRMQVKQRVQ